MVTSAMRILFVTSLMLVTSQALTNMELVFLLNSASTDFQISIVSNEVLRINISGEPSRRLEGCYNTSLGCCLPNTRLHSKKRQEFLVPRSPTAGAETYCVPQGPVGVSIDGAEFHNHFEENCMDVNRYVEGNFDSCNGHRNFMGEYHYHRAPNPICLKISSTSEPQIIGVALDGFPIYNSNIYNGVIQPLDECGGFMLPSGSYRYVASFTSSSPVDHVIPCFKGVPLQPKCCECRECGRTQLPGCQRNRGGIPSPFANLPNLGGGRRNFGVGPPPGFDISNIFRQGNNFGGFPPRPNRNFARRPNRTEFQIPEFENREGFCSRQQLTMLIGKMFRPGGRETNCTGCTECVPNGGYQTLQDAERCHRCKIRREITAAITGRGQNSNNPPQRGFGSRGNPAGTQTNSILQALGLVG